MKKFVPIILAMLMLTGCKPTSEKIAIAIGLTQTAIAEVQPLVTNTLEPTVTATPAPTLTPTPDFRVVGGDPKDFLLTIADLPKESQFYLPNSEWTGRHSNNEVIQGWGIDEGRVYLETTGRVEGWWIALLRGSVKLTAPEEIYCEVVQYQTTNGAQLSLTDYNVVEKPTRVQHTYLWAKEDYPDLGDISNSYFREWTADSGEMYMEYDIEATYMNYFVHCIGYGRKIEVKPEYVENLVSIILVKMKAVSLVMP